MRQILLLLGSIVFLSCSVGDKQGDQYVLWVNSSLTSCVGRAPSKCLQVQKYDKLDPSAWETLQSAIEGFEYEPGYFYKIVVKERQLETGDLPEDSTSITYTLLKILEKKQDERFRINDQWEVLKIKEENIQPDMEGISTPQLEIHVGEMRYSGNDGCNNYNGGIIEMDEQLIRFGVAAATRMMCPEMRIPDLFNAILPEVKSWEVKENKLHLFNAEGTEVMQLKKSD
jgi:heat shock protein HslJ